MIGKAVLAIIALAVLGGGCAQFLTLPQDDGISSSQAAQLAAAQNLQRSGKYTDALTAYRSIVRQHPKTEAAAAAKYSIALLHALADNPEKDYAQALVEFDEFTRIFPQHQRAEEAKSWAQVIRMAIDAKKENERLSKNIERLKQLDVKQEEKRLGR